MTVMAETSFEVKYDGEALRDGRMPVRDLAPALLSLGDLFRDASLLLYPDNDPVSLEIEATKEGSFDVALVLQAAGMGWEQIAALAGSGAATSLILFKDLVIGDTADLSLLGLVRRLRGRRVTEEVDGPEPGQTSLKVEGDLIIVKSEVAILNRDSGVRDDLRRVVEPLRQPGVDALQFRSSGKAVELEKDDAPAFELPEPEQEEIVSDEEIELHLTVLQPSLEEEGGNKWKFGGLGETTFVPPSRMRNFLGR